jgi:NADH-quinone oxidoreductase subunit M
MDFLNDNILSIIIFAPAIAALVIMLLPDDEENLIRRLAFVFSLVPLALTLYIWFQFDRSYPTFQFEQVVEWFPSIGASYHVGVDGISLALILLTTILTPLSILASFEITERVKMYMALFLALETGMLGLFASLDLLIFFVFWEIGLVPMYFLIRLWGGADRDYASFKFFIYTMAGSLGLLLSIQLIGLATGTFDIVELMDVWVNLSGATLPGSGLPVDLVKGVAYVLFVIAFAIKVPIWPFHTWLPDAHTEAPTAGSMILAGVLLKLGAYGFVRLVIPLFPEIAQHNCLAIGGAGHVEHHLRRFAAYGQWDFQAPGGLFLDQPHGFCHSRRCRDGALLRLGDGGTASAPLVEDAIMATNGAVFQMFNHGLSAAGMFFLVGVIYHRTHTRDLKLYGGIWSVLPAFGAILIFTSMASLGLPA